MKNIPVFDTENGVASLILKEVPYSQTAYVKILDTQSVELLLEECIHFCRMVGAEHIYATGHPFLEKYPIHTKILQMQIARDALPETDACLISITGETQGKFCDVYNERMAQVDNAAYLTNADATEIRKEGSGYFVYRDEMLLGIGIASDDTIYAVISAQPGCGQDVLLALVRALSSEQVQLTVASTNIRAIHLYERLGFAKTGELSCWYRLL